MAKIMSYEDLSKARAARIAKDKAAADKGKGKCGCKRKVSPREAEGNVEGESECEGDIGGDIEVDVDAQKMSSSISTAKNKRAKRSSVQEPKPWRAPVALMYKETA